MGRPRKDHGVQSPMTLAAEKKLREDRKNARLQGFWAWLWGAGGEDNAGDLKEDYVESKERWLRENK